MSTATATRFGTRKATSRAASVVAAAPPETLADAMAEARARAPLSPLAVRAAGQSASDAATPPASASRLRRAAVPLATGATLLVALAAGYAMYRTDGTKEAR